MTFDELWHRHFRVPYNLSKPIDTGAGTPVVLLHGIGRSAKIWQPLVSRLQKLPFRVIAFDLLGFGESPKPTWPKYVIDDQARNVISNIKRQRFGEPVVLVGHSLGALVALRVARLRPDLVRHVVLYEMPLYDGLPEKRHYKARLAVYFKFYEWIVNQQPTFGEAKQRFGERVGSKIVGLELTKATWQPFIKTLQNSIMTQTAADDIQQLVVPADVIYGFRDMLVIRGQVANIFGKDVTNITGHTINSSHKISAVAAKFLAQRLKAAMEPSDVK